MKCEGIEYNFLKQRGLSEISVNIRDYFEIYHKERIETESARLPQLTQSHRSAKLSVARSESET